MSQSHGELVALAARWLRTAKRCPVVLVEAAGGGLEVPDAIGFQRGGRMSIVVECKASRADFLADKKKSHRRSGAGLGQARYYLTPAGMLIQRDLPAGWGLIEVRDGKPRVRVQAPKVEVYDPDVQRRETGVLFSALAGLQDQGAVVCGQSGARVHQRVRRKDGSYYRSCLPCVRAARSCVDSAPSAWSGAVREPCYS